MGRAGSWPARISEASASVEVNPRAMRAITLMLFFKGSTHVLERSGGLPRVAGAAGLTVGSLLWPLIE